MISRRAFIGSLAAIPATTAFSAPVISGRDGWNVRDFGAVGDGRTVDTSSVQKAIIACEAGGGGRVIFPTGGTFLIGTIYLRSHVTLYLETNATILGSSDLTQYGADTGVSPYASEPLSRCLIYANGATDIGLAGNGTIVGRASEKYFAPAGATPDEAKQRPMLIRFENCNKITISDLTFERCGAWCIHLKHGRSIFVRNLRINNQYQDGIDIEGCENTTITDCQMICGDDCIALITSSPERPVRNLIIANCILKSRCSGIRIGPRSAGDFENVTVSNCVLYDCFLGGIKLGMFEGAEIRNCSFSNLVMENVTCPISMFIATWPDIGSIALPPKMMPPGKIRHLQFRGIRAVVKLDPPSIKPDRNGSMFFHGHPDSMIENITLEDIDITFPGGGTQQDAMRRDIIDMDRIDYRKGGYWTDDKNVWGIPPAFGLYARHVKGLTLSNVKLGLASADMRSAATFFDCERLELSHVDTQSQADIPIVTMVNSSSAVLSNVQSESLSILLRLEGKKSADVELLNNDKRHYSKLFECAAGADASSISVK